MLHFRFAAWRTALGTSVLSAAALGCSGSEEEKTPPADLSVVWPMYGGTPEATRASSDTKVSTDNVAGLVRKWEAKVKRCTATPAVGGGAVYFGDWGGSAFAHRATTGELIWSARLSSFALDSSPLLMGDKVYFADGGGTLHAVSRANGTILWSKELDDHPTAHLFSSPVGFENLVLIGVASQELVSSKADYTFKGSLLAVDATSGNIVWKTFVTEDDATSGAGCSVWSSFAIDPALRLAYIGVGQTYEQPASPYSDALVAVRIDSGEIAWHRQYTPNDVFVIGRPQGPDFDIGAAPNVFSVDGMDLVGVGDKGGNFAAFHRDNGEPAWGPIRLSNGSAQGGVMDPAAFANGILYMASNDIMGSGIDDPLPGDIHVVRAVNAANGSTVWEQRKTFPSVGGLTFSNGLVFNISTDGTVYALDAVNGDQLWSDPMGTIAAAGVTVADGMVYACNGFGFFKTITGGAAITGSLVAYGLP
jgi:polyvinyl alcohol dehydrogenase (cytochrome)